MRLSKKNRLIVILIDKEKDIAQVEEIVNYH